jgi:hypothetical protein
MSKVRDRYDSHPNESQSETKAFVIASIWELVTLHGAPTGIRKAEAPYIVISVMRMSIV